MRRSAVRSCQWSIFFDLSASSDVFIAGARRTHTLVSESWNLQKTLCCSECGLLWFRDVVFHLCRSVTCSLGYVRPNEIGWRAMSRPSAARRARRHTLCSMHVVLRTVPSFIACSSPAADEFCNQSRRSNVSRHTAVCGGIILSPHHLITARVPSSRHTLANRDSLDHLPGLAIVCNTVLRMGPTT